MSEDADVVRLPDRDDGPDTEPGPPPRGGAEILKEAALALPHLTVLLYRLLRDRRVPLRRKLMASAVAAYVVSPIDLIPDFIPIAGQVDDVLVVALALDHLIRDTDEAVVREHWPGSEDALDLIEGVIAWAAELVPAPLRRLVAR
jgi:uncharacterized membrane protein YkvA (DUF1232 family)